MKTREKRLLFALLGILLIGGLVIGSDYFFDERERLLNEQGQLRNEWIVIETLFEEKDLWEMRSTWLEEKQPRFTSSEAADQAIYQESLAQGVSGVTTSKQNLLPAVSTPNYVQAGVSLSASGTLGDVFRWLYDLNQPEDFRVVRNLKVVPDKESPEHIIATFELLRWYAPAPSPEA